MLNKGLHGGNALDLSCYLSVTYALGKPYISISLLDKKVMLHNKSTKCSLSTNAMMLTTVREGPGAAGLPVPLVRVLEEVGLYFDVVKKETNVKD